MYVQNHKMKLMEGEFNDVLEQPKDLVIKYIYDQVAHKNSNFLGLWVGKPGVGKSRGALKACEKSAACFGRRMTISHVVFSIEEFLKLVVELQQRFKSGEDVRGTCILYDEAGVSMDNRDWQNKVHKVMNDTMETFRFLGLIVMFTAPGRGRIDSKLRELVHAIFHPKKKSKTHLTVKFYILKDSIISNKEYKVNLRVESRGWRLKVGSIEVTMPSKELDGQYEAAMRKFKYAINVRGLRELAPTRREEVVEQRALTDRQRQILRLSEAGLMVKEIAKQLGIEQAGVQTHLRNIRAKGYNV